jgi:hypothetical protein
MKTESKYYIDYIHSNPTGDSYHQLVRRSDDAILYANPNLDYALVYCFKAGIHRDEVVIL